MWRFNVVLTLIAVLVAFPFRASGEPLPRDGTCADDTRIGSGREPCSIATYATYGDARLTRLIDEALENNPSAREALASYEAELQQVPQVTALPDDDRHGHARAAAHPCGAPEQAQT